MITKQSLPEAPDFPAGEVILINKDLDWTSFDVVNSLKIFLKYEFGIKKIKIGHAGTLDPKATGLVIVCTGKKTKEIDSYQAQEKEYTGTFFIGKTTPSFDTEKQPDKDFPTAHLSDELIRQTTEKFTGEIIQTPPVYSAVKIDGKKAYDYARKNEKVKLKERKVRIYRFDIENINLPLVDFRIKCSKGTYIRSLADDFGRALGSGAYLYRLCRTAIGDYRVEDALTISGFKKFYAKNSPGG